MIWSENRVREIVIEICSTYQTRLSLVANTIAQELEDLKEISAQTKQMQTLTKSYLNDIKSLVEKRLEEEKIFYEVLPILDFFDRENAVSTETLSERSNIPIGQVRQTLKKWVDMGVVIKNGNEYRLNTDHPFHLIADGFFKEASQAIDNLSKHPLLSGRKT